MKFKPVPRKTNPSKMDFEGLIAKGVIDTECGMRAQTVNGEARCFGEVENTGGGGPQARDRRRRGAEGWRSR